MIQSSKKYWDDAQNIEIENYLPCKFHLYLLVTNCDDIGVEDAFCATGKVLTVSFHKHSPGFFPGISAGIVHDGLTS